MKTQKRTAVLLCLFSIPAGKWIVFSFQYMWQTCTVFNVSPRTPTAKLPLRLSSAPAASTTPRSESDGRNRDRSAA